MEKGKKKISIGLILVIISIVLIASGGILLSQSDLFKSGNNTNNNTSKNDNQNNTNDNTVIDGNISFGGSYINDANENMYLYILNKTNLSYTIVGESSFYQGIATIAENKASDEILELVLGSKSNTIKVVAKDSAISIKNNEFKRDGEFTALDFYEKNIGDTKYLSSEINGVYEIEKENGNGAKMSIIQVDENSIEFTIKDADYNFFSDYLRKKDENTFESGEEYEQNEISKIEVNNDKIIFSTSNEMFNFFNGTYVKKGKLDIDEIIKNKIGFVE